MRKNKKIALELYSKERQSLLPIFYPVSRHLNAKYKTKVLEDSNISVEILVLAYV